MKKLITYTAYLIEYIRYGDFGSVLAAVRYLISRKSHSKDRIIQTATGRYFCRKDTNDFQFANFRYEWNVKKFILSRLTSFDLFIDVGACIGEYSIWLAGKGKHCIAFEPVKQNFEVLQKNIELNNLSDKIIPYSFGLSDSNGQQQITFNPVNTGASHLSVPGDASGIEATFRTLDSLLGELGISSENKLMIKLDLEGMEPDAIRGMAGLLKQHPSVTLIAEYKHSVKDQIELLLEDMAEFEFGIIDKYNLFAVKISGNQ